MRGGRPPCAERPRRGPPYTAGTVRPSDLNLGAARSGTTRPWLAATLSGVVDVGALQAEDALVAIARAGYAAVQWSATAPGLRPRDLDSSGRRGVVVALKRLELVSVGVDAWIPPGHFLDPATIDRAVTAIALAVRLASDLAPTAHRSVRGDLPNVSVLLPSAAELAARPALSTQLADALAQLTIEADRLGVRIADHAPEPRPESPLAIGIDPALLIASARDPSAETLRAGARLAAARLVDCHRSGMRGPIGEPGEARLDVDAYAVALECVEFRGPPIVDLRQWRDPLGGLAATMERWAPPFAQSIKNAATRTPTS